jgi:hypothetical protein
MRPSRRQGNWLEIEKLNASNAEHPCGQQKVEPENGE